MADGESAEPLLEGSAMSRVQPASGQELQEHQGERWESPIADLDAKIALPLSHECIDIDGSLTARGHFPSTSGTSISLVLVPVSAFFWLFRPTPY
jgi:hypothetical protein